MAQQTNTNEHYLIITFTDILVQHSDRCNAGIGWYNIKDKKNSHASKQFEVIIMLGLHNINQNEKRVIQHNCNASLMLALTFMLHCYLSKG